ncbi:hypothetical protein TcWFU_005478 [Taenia crassiceps]|uniref:Uncharacterized protein n=1 Tax=Taenia crassiceps TaxID=6207 RepID=A0ABR4QQR7_9CEST
MTCQEPLDVLQILLIEVHFLRCFCRDHSIRLQPCARQAVCDREQARQHERLIALYKSNRAIIGIINKANIRIGSRPPMWGVMLNHAPMCVCLTACLPEFTDGGHNANQHPSSPTSIEYLVRPPLIDNLTSFVNQNFCSRCSRQNLLQQPAKFDFSIILSCMPINENCDFEELEVDAPPIKAYAPSVARALCFPFIPLHLATPFVPSAACSKLEQWDLV